MSSDGDLLSAAPPQSAPLASARAWAADRMAAPFRHWGRAPPAAAMLPCPWRFPHRMNLFASRRHGSAAARAVALSLVFASLPSLAQDLQGRQLQRKAAAGTACACT